MNIRPYLIINGVNSQSIQGLLVSELAPISKPQQRTQIDEVDGRDGDIVTPLGFAAYDKRVKIGLSYDYDIDDIIEFFNSSGVVTFSNEPDKYYRFAIYEQIDFERLIRFKTAEVTLHCQPFKFSTTETPKLFNVTSGSPITVKNDGNYQSRPNLTIIGSGDVDLSLNGSQVLSLDLEDNQAIIIDTEDMNAYAAQTAIKEVIAEINPVQEGSGDPSPDNIRPITGFTESNVTLFGVNVWGGNALLQSFIDANIYGFSYDTTNKTFAYSAAPINGINVYSNYKFKENTQYTFILTLSNSNNSSSTNIYVAYTDGTSTHITINPPTANLKKTGVFTTASGKTVSHLKGVNHSGTITVYYEESGVFEGVLTAEDFVPYLGSEYTIAFEDDQGDPITVYGGSLNVTTGILTIKGGLYSTTWTQFNQNNGYKAYRSSSFIRAKSYENAKSNTIGTFGSFSSSSMNKNIIQLPVDSSTYVYMALDENVDPTTVQIYYEFFTPQEIQLTPTQINNLLGLNQMYSDNNGDISVTFSSNGVIQTETGDIVSFNVAVEDMQKGILLNRLVIGDYDKIRLSKGNNTLVLTGGAQQLVIDKYSRWI